MKFRFAADAVNDAQSWRHLDAMLNSAADGWHEWEIDDPDGLEKSAWFTRTNRPHLKDFFEKSIQAGAYSNPSSNLHKHRWLITNQASSGDTLTPQAAALYFTTPLRICVENEFTDKLFVDTVLSFLVSQELKEFFDQFQEGQKKPLEYLHGGGNGQLDKLIERRVDESVAQGIRFRAVTVTDSDARFPGDQERMKTPLKIDDVCKRHDIPCLVLSKRTIENYIPNEVLQGWAGEPGNQAVMGLVDVVCGLTAEQRDHLPMKKKLPDANKLTSQETELYTSISSQEKNILNNSKLDGEPIQLFGKYKQYLTAEGLRKRDGQGELDRLVTMITEEL